MNQRDYVAKVYAGVLGKIIGVYMGRPFEGWTYEQIIARFGEVRTFVNGEVGAPLVLTDDDIAGTFTFIRALEDYGYDPDLSAASIGQTWLNYLINERTILWWGGMGNSTEHTAYLRLRDGIKAPASGSVAVNGRTTANQIGGQIFIDGWALVSPDNPKQAAALARKAASVSHDEEAVNAAVFIAVLEAQAFTQPDIDTLLDTALEYTPPDSIIARQTRDVRAFHAKNRDWKVARAWLDDVYGYARYKGVCHVVPNFGLIVMSLLYGNGDFRSSLMMVNTSGHDTDCNSGTLGCILGIRNGLDAIEACPDLRAPHRDLIFIPSADGARCVSDALREAYTLANMHFRISGQPLLLPKDGARYHFDQPGALHAFHSLEGEGLALAELQNALLPGTDIRALRISFEAGGPVIVATPVFSLGSRTEHYTTQASPALYPGQTLRCTLVADSHNTTVLRGRLFVSAFATDDRLQSFLGPETAIDPGTSSNLAWQLDPGLTGPIVEAGVQITSANGTSSTAWLERMDWQGAPQCTFRRSKERAAQWWKNAWVNGVDEWGAQFPESFHLSQNRGTGLIIQGSREWTDYEANAVITPFQSVEAGLAVRVQGMKRYYAILLCRDGRVRLVKERDGKKILGERDLGVREYDSYEMRLTVRGSTITGFVNGRMVTESTDHDDPLECGAVGLVITEGTLTCDEVKVSPIPARP